MKLQELRERLLGEEPKAPERKDAISQIWGPSDLATRAQPEGLSSRKPAAKNPQTSALVLSAAQEDKRRAGAVAERLWLPNGVANRIQELTALLESLETLARSTAEELKTLEAFERRMEQLERTLEPMKTFCRKREQFALGFEPIEILREQMVGIIAEFSAQLLKLGKLFGPAIALRLRVTELVKAFEPVDRLAAEFARLAEVFRL
jgi:hypothetical protein